MILVLNRGYESVQTYYSTIFWNSVGLADVVIKNLSYGGFRKQAYKLLQNYDPEFIALTNLTRDDLPFPVKGKVISYYQDRAVNIKVSPDDYYFGYTQTDAECNKVDVPVFVDLAFHQENIATKNRNILFVGNRGFTFCEFTDYVYSHHKPISRVPQSRFIRFLKELSLAIDILNDSEILDIFYTMTEYKPLNPQDKAIIEDIVILGWTAELVYRQYVLGEFDKVDIYGKDWGRNVSYKAKYPLSHTERLIAFRNYKSGLHIQRNMGYNQRMLEMLLSGMKVYQKGKTNECTQFNAKDVISKYNNFYGQFRDWIYGGCVPDPIYIGSDSCIGYNNAGEIK